jgi:aldehyde dehydrogenase family protein
MSRTAPAMAVEAGYVWINEFGKHFLGAPFGGFKESGLGREECFTQEKNIHVKLKLRTFVADTVAPPTHLDAAPLGCAATALT